MLIEFSVTNFKSIKDRQTLSLVASKGREMADTQTLEAPCSGAGSSITLLPSVAIYGANAAGKSNLLESLQTMKDIVLGSAQQHRGDFVPVVPFKLDATTRNAPTEFEVIFIAEDVRYQYGFSATRERIVDEWLFAYPKNRLQHWLGREWDKKKKQHEWLLGPSLMGEKNLWQKSTRDNALYLSTAAQLNSQQLQPVFDWFIKIFDKDSISRWGHDISVLLCDREDTKEDVLEYLRAADLDIDSIQVEKTTFESVLQHKNTPRSMRQTIVREEEKKFRYDVQTMHHDPDGESVVFDFDEESDGTQKFFSLIWPWIDVLTNGYVLLVDELNNSLHPKLVEYLVSLFNNKKTNPNNAQLIFTTHDITILNQKTLRRDQIWFCEKDEIQTTQVYPLSDFRPRKGRENLEQMYLSGRYGALPYIESAQG